MNRNDGHKTEDDLSPEDKKEFLRIMSSYDPLKSQIENHLTTNTAFYFLAVRGFSFSERTATVDRSIGQRENEEVKLRYAAGNIDWDKCEKQAAEKVAKEIEDQVSALFALGKLRFGN